MDYIKIKKKLNNSEDLKFKKMKNICVIYLESLCSSDKVNDYIFEPIAINKGKKKLENVVSGPNMVYLKKDMDVINYLFNGFAIVYNKRVVVAIECKADLYRSISEAKAEPSINGPKDSFNESIQTNLGLIRRRIRSEHLTSKDYTIGSISKTQVSLLYLDDIADIELVKKVEEKLDNVNLEIMMDMEVLENGLEDNKGPMPTILKTERPDKVCSALRDGKIVLIGDNSPYALILPAFFVDFLHPEGDSYVKPINANFIKTLRMVAMLISLFLPALYIAIINFNPETVPLNLLLSFQSAHEGVPFSSTIEIIFMIFLCYLLRESDVRFPSSYGSSISILGALILGDAAVSANIVSPITIIIVGITFIAGLIFNNGNFIDALRYYRFGLIISASLFGLYGLLIGTFILLIHLVSMEVLGIPYLYPVAPFNRNYFKLKLLESNKINKVEK